MRILVVEDSPDTLRLLDHLLKRSYSVALAGTPEEALAFAAEGPFDAVLMDINLGAARRTGIELMQELRRDHGYARIPIIAITAYALPGDRERLLAAGFDAYVAKPFFKKQVLDTLERFGVQC